MILDEVYSPEMTQKDSSRKKTLEYDGVFKLKKILLFWLSFLLLRCHSETLTIICQEQRNISSGSGDRLQE